MNKIIIQCNTFMKVDDFKKLSEEIKDNFEKGVVVLPAYCELKAVLEADDVEVLDKNNPWNGWQE